MTLILRIPGATFTDNTLPVLKRDSIVSAGTRFIYDFSNSFSWPESKTPANGDSVKNLVSGASDASVYIGARASIQYSGGGFKFDSEPLEGVVIPDSAGMLQSTNNGFIYTAWVKHLAQTATSTQGIISGNTYQTGIENQYSLTYVWSSGSYNMRADAVVPSPIVLAINEIAQISIAYLPDGVGGHKARLYKNGAKVGVDAATAGPLNVPVTSGYVHGIGNAPGQNSGGLSHDWTGVIYRNWLEDISISQPSASLMESYADAQVYKDYTNNAGRFS